MTSAEPSTAEQPGRLHSRSYRITVDDGRDSFFALSIEDAANDEAWLMSDTVLALGNMR
ncbi:hypothetical protein [Natronococcus pandeyae]|uniref:hypothetical protein n=1 Tax=Natronococcus pandeyae TaxID=2055836 RepID=UPI001652DE63|nr:hypothetical protein [Natronococcus pandeyae]